MYVDDEITALEKSIAANKHIKHRNVKMIYIWIAIIFGGLAVLSTQSVFSTDKIMGRWMPDTWRCPNLDCQYDNYEGMDYCGLCGTPKPRGRR